MQPEGLEPKNVAEDSDAADEWEQPALEAQGHMDGVNDASDIDAGRTEVQPRPQSRRSSTIRTKRRGWSASEMSTLALLHAVHGNKWSAIARHYRNRHDGDVKNIFHSAFRSKTDGNCLLRAYAQAVGPSCDDVRVRQAAYEAARHQCGSAPLLSSAVSYVGVQPLELADDKFLEEGSAGAAASDPSDDQPPALPIDEEAKPSGRPSATGTPLRPTAEANDPTGADLPWPSNPQPLEPPSALRPRRSRRLAMLVESAQAANEWPMQDATAAAATAAPTTAISQRLPHDILTQLRAHRSAASACIAAEADWRLPPEPGGDAVFSTAAAMDAFAAMPAGVDAAVASGPGGSRIVPPPALPAAFPSSASHALPAMPNQTSMQLLAARASVPASPPGPTPAPSPTPLLAGSHVAAPPPNQLPPSGFGALPGIQPWTAVSLYGSVPPPQSTLASYNVLAGETRREARRPPRSVSLPVQAASGGAVGTSALLSLRPEASTPAPPPTPTSTGPQAPGPWQQPAPASCNPPDDGAWHQQRHPPRSAAAAMLSLLPGPIGMAEGQGSHSDVAIRCLEPSTGGQGPFTYFNDDEMRLLGDMGAAGTSAGAAAGAGVSSSLYGSTGATAASLGGGRAGGGGGGLGCRADTRDPIAAVLWEIGLYDDPFYDMALATGLGSAGRSAGGLPGSSAAGVAPGDGSHGPDGGAGGVYWGNCAATLGPPSVCGPATGTSQSPASLLASLSSSHLDMWQGGNQSDGLVPSGAGFASAGANVPPLLQQHQQQHPQQQRFTSPLLGSFDWQRPVAPQLPPLPLTTLPTFRSAQLQPTYQSRGTEGTAAPVMTALLPSFSLHPVSAPGLGTGLAAGQGVGAGLAQGAVEVRGLAQAHGSRSGLPAMGAGLYDTVEGPVDVREGAAWTHVQTHMHMQMQSRAQAQMQPQGQPQVQTLGQGRSLGQRLALREGEAHGVLCPWVTSNPYSTVVRHPALQPPVSWEPLLQLEPGSQAIAAGGARGQTPVAGMQGGLQAARPSVAPASRSEPQGGVPGSGPGGASSAAVRLSW